MKPLCSWCKKPIEQDNHYLIVRKFKWFLFLTKKQVWEFHTPKEAQQWLGHSPKGGEK